jgi:hypothetical protein
MRNVSVESADGEDFPSGCWDVFVDNEWAALFRKRDEAEEWAESKRLEP